MVKGSLTKVVFVFGKEGVKEERLAQKVKNVPRKT